MLRDWFDERFKEAGARSFHASAVRVLMAGAIWAILGLGVGWPVAGFWVLAVVGVEWPLREVTRPMARGLTLSRVEAFLCMAVYTMVIAAWSAAGVLLWGSDQAAFQIGGLAFFAAQLLYLDTHHGRSLGALIPALPALAAPVLAPLIVQHFHGVDQVLVEVTMLAVVSDAAVSIGVNFIPPKRLTVAKAGMATAAHAPVAIPALARPLRVLAAEDNAINQLVLKTLLAQAGVEPMVVGDGRAALEAWTQEPWDLILMDVRMPVMDGPSTARAIRAAEAESGRAYTPIVALTANATPHQIADYAAAGMDGHVAKPIEAASLYAALELAQRPAPRAARKAGNAAAA